VSVYCVIRASYAAAIDVHHDWHAHEDCKGKGRRPFSI
jgi:hypothetical protein